MSSKSERQATAVWLMIQKMTESGSDPGLLPVKAALERLRPFVLQPADYDTAMARIDRRICEFLLTALTRQPGCNLIDIDSQAAYLYMLAALAGDQWSQCPDKPAARKRNWRRLNNAIIGFLEKLQEEGDGDLGVEQGCRWAETVKEMLNKA